MCFWNFIVLVDRQQQIDHLLGYTINDVHKIQKHIDYIYIYIYIYNQCGFGIFLK